MGLHCLSWVTGYFQRSESCFDRAEHVLFSTLHLLEKPFQLAERDGHSVFRISLSFLSSPFLHFPFPLSSCFPFLLSSQKNFNEHKKNNETIRKDWGAWAFVTFIPGRGLIALAFACTMFTRSCTKNVEGKKMARCIAGRQRCYSLCAAWGLCSAGVWAWCRSIAC